MMIGGQSAVGGKLRSRKGQSLIIALSVMFILVFLGTVFVTLVARNLTSAVRSGDVLIARQLAEAGINYANRMLTYSDDGADWRPEPANLDKAANGNHPDIEWLQPYEPTESSTGGPNGGFTSFTGTNGRYLLRVSYNPDPADQASRFIKVEAVGRAGFVDSNFLGSGTPDPTTYANTGPVRLRHELTAFKPIGITDYSRFVTNRAKRSDAFSFGKAFGPKPIIFGGKVIGQERTGPLRVNGNLVWRGKNEVHLRSVNAATGERIPIDRVEVAGEISAADSDTEVLVFNNGVLQGTAQPTRINGTLNENFATFQGLYRDGVDQADSAGFGRAVKRLEPPLVDQEDPSSGQARFARLTRYSGFSVRLDGGRYTSSAYYGYGDGMYIGNRRDTQQDGSSVFGGTPSLADEWVTPNNKGNWRGRYYVPPGVVIRINPDETLTVTRTDSVRRGQKYVWYRYDSANNNLIPDPGAGPTMTLPYPRNGVVYAEGNIRISGMVAPDRQLTIVSNENIYIEGNILKSDQVTSAISLLARKNVVVNTTQFMSLPPMTTAIWESTVGGGNPPYAYRVTTSPSTNFVAAFTLGHWYDANSLRAPSAYPGWGGGKQHLFIRHASSGATASINLFVNGAPYDFGGSLNYLMATAETQYGPIFEGQVFPLDFGGAPGLDGVPGSWNNLQIGLHQTGLEQSRGDYLLEGIALVPMDINIQALCYAQDGSFFVIPGPWFNSNPADNRSAAARPPEIRHPAFPFYGEPLDIKITIDGAVAENMPAAASHVDEWMRHWSNIPVNYGSSPENTAHPEDGLSFVYDPMLAFPVRPDGSPVRTDKFGRALPVTPRLPVSPDLIYVGRLSS